MSNDKDTNTIGYKYLKHQNWNVVVSMCSMILIPLWFQFVNVYRWLCIIQILCKSTLPHHEFRRFDRIGTTLFVWENVSYMLYNGYSMLIRVAMECAVGLVYGSERPHRQRSKKKRKVRKTSLISATPQQPKILRHWNRFRPRRVFDNLFRILFRTLGILVDRIHVFTWNWNRIRWVFFSQSVSKSILEFFHTFLLVHFLSVVSFQKHLQTDNSLLR